jgi:hypothetical protein
MSEEGESAHDEPNTSRQPWKQYTHMIKAASMQKWTYRKEKKEI